MQLPIGVDDRAGHISQTGTAEAAKFLCLSGLSSSNAASLLRCENVSLAHVGSHPLHSRS